MADTHRLKDITTEEVSLVDRPANKQKFLIVKRSDDMGASKELVDDGNGNLVAKTENDDDAKKKADADKAKADADKAKADAKKPPFLKSALGTLTKSAVDLVAVGRSLEAAVEKDEDGKLDEATVEALRTVGKSVAEVIELDLDAVQKKIDAAKADEKDEKKQEGDKKKPPFLKRAFEVVKDSAGKLVGCAKAVEAFVEKNGDDEAKLNEAKLDDEVKKNLTEAVEGVLAVAAGKLDMITEVEKAGSRMAKERLGRFKNALDSLTKILTELIGETPAAKRDDSPGVPSEDVRRLTAAVEELTTIAKAQAKDLEEAKHEITRLRKGVNGSNALPVEGDVKKSDGGEVSWPMDMNRPITRDTVKKGMSFFDD